MFKLLCFLVVNCVFYGVAATALNIGDNCTQDGVPGVCKLWSECTLAARYRDGKRVVSPCAADGVESVVCCNDASYIATLFENMTKDRSTTTESSPTEDPIESKCEPLPANMTPKKTGRKAWDKCIEYQKKLVFPCERSVALIGGYNRVDNCQHSADPIIFGGSIANTDEFPHMVQLALATSKELFNTALWQCSGSLLSDRFILTAAHCTSATINGKYHILTFAAIGSLQNQNRRVYEEDGSQIYTIDKIIKHPYYNRRDPNNHATQKYHDIALVNTTTRMTLSSSTVPVCLDVFGGKRSFVTATGWGSTDDPNDKIPHMLQKVTLKQFNDTICRRTFSPRRSLRQGVDLKRQMCYGHDTDNCDTCDGDSGSALVIRNPLVDCMYSAIAITSLAAARCGSPGTPGLYTKVAEYVPWIEQYVWPDDD